MSISIGEQYYISPEDHEKLHNTLDRVMNPRPYQDIIKSDGCISGERIHNVYDYISFQKAAMDSFVEDLNKSLILEEIPW